MQNQLLRVFVPASACLLLAATSMQSPALAGDTDLSSAKTEQVSSIHPQLIEAWSMEREVQQATPSKTSSDKIAAPTQAYSHGEPTAEEQLMLEMINRARSNPAAEGELLTTTDDPDVNRGITSFNIDRNLVKSQFDTYPARPPLAFHPLLMVSAERHSMDMIQGDFQDHTGSDGTTPFDRMNQAEYLGWSAAGENIFAFSRSIFHGHAGFNIDWGGNNQISLGHRKAIMNFESTVYTEIGISVEHEDDGATRVGPLVITQNFGLRRDYYITGVVYNDLNNNNFYDVGEGLAGVEIMPDNGDFYAVTSQSGGYAIPVAANSSITSVTASGGGISSPISKNVNIVNSQNFKLDFTPTDVSQGLAAPVNLNPADAHISQTSTVMLSWSAVDGAQNYEVEVRENAAEGPVVFSAADLTEPSIEFLIPRNDEQFFWRVRALEAGAAGEWSVTHSISSESQPADPPTLVSPASGSLVREGNIQFIWEPAEGAETYRFTISEGQPQNEPFARDQEIREQTVRVAPNGNWEFTFNPTGLLETNTDYWWTLSSVNAAGEGSPADPRHFIITDAVATSATLPVTIKSSIRISPNPTADKLTLSLELPASADVVLSVYDQHGRLALPALPQRRLAHGFHELHLNTSALSAGMYSYKIEVDGKFDIGQIVIIR